MEIFIINKRKYILWYLLGLMLYINPVIAFSQNVGAEGVNIVFSLERSVDDGIVKNKNFSKDFEIFCKGIGSRLIINKGPFMTGVFTGFNCATDKIHLGGKKFDSNWKLIVNEDEANFNLSLQFKNKVQAELKIPRHSEVFKMLKDKGILDQYSLNLLNQLPMAFAFSYKQNGKKLKYKTAALTAVTSDPELRISPPSNLILYTLDFNDANQMWIPTVVGNAKKIEFKEALLEEKSESQAKDKNGKKKLFPQNKKIKFKDGLIVWEIMITASPKSIGKKVIWAHSEEGRYNFDKSSKVNGHAENIAEKYSGITKSLLDDLTKIFKDTTASGYFGIRYGKQILKGNVLLEQTDFLGFLGEIRGGPLKGARFYYDKVDRVEISEENLQLSLEWSRLTLGTSIGFDFDFLINRIDIVPRIGQWTFKSVLPIETADSTISQEFEISNRLSFGIELGLEYVKPWTTIRLWAGRDQAFTYGGKGVSGISSSRVGIDTYFALGSKFSLFGAKFQLNILGFGFIESVGLDSTASEDGSQDFFIESVSYDAGYIGTGFAISW